MVVYVANLKLNVTKRSSEMAFTKPGLTTSPSITSTSSTKRLIFFCFILFLFFPLLLLTTIFPSPQLIDVVHLPTVPISSPNHQKKLLVQLPRWLEVIRGSSHVALQRPLRLGLVNFEDTDPIFPQLGSHHGVVESVTIDFESVFPNVTWKSLFPEWIDETLLGKQCPKIPMPEPGRYLGLDVVVVQMPCEEIKKRQQKYNNVTTQKGKTQGIRDIHRLHLSLATAKLILENTDDGRIDEGVYAVFIGECEPMMELFKCDDLVWHKGEYWVYKPKVDKLREMVSMPVGSCDLAHPYPYSGTRHLQANYNQLLELQRRRREAYVTILHSSEEYVCGAIALAQSILQTNTTKDLILLADWTISNHSIKGLQASGWKIKRIDRIRSPGAKTNAYNKWNYSKLRVWQLTEYDKVMFIDSDFIVLHNIDHFFDFPQLSAAPNDKWLFNSGVMILEPSECFFNHLMKRRYALKSYNGGDQGYLNEVLTWWHRLTRKLNFMKFFGNKREEERLIPKDRYTIHFLGMKPWTCYRDYDCNWDRQDYQVFASDAVNARWWQVYDSMAPELQSYCGMTVENDSRIKKRRQRAQKANLSDWHWRTEIKDPRQYSLVSSPRKKQKAI